MTDDRVVVEHYQKSGGVTASNNWRGFLFCSVIGMFLGGMLGLMILQKFGLILGIVIGGISFATFIGEWREIRVEVLQGDDVSSFGN